MNDYGDDVRRKAERMRLAREQRRSIWRHLGQIGALGWTLILPILLAAVLGGVLADRLDRPWLALLVVALGVIIGGYTSWRQIRRSLEEE